MDATAPAERHFAGLCTRIILQLVEWRLGPEAVDEVLASAGDSRPASVLMDDTSWSSHEQFRRLLEAVARRLGSPDELRTIDEMPMEVWSAGTRPDITALLQTFGSPMAVNTTVGSSVVGPGMDVSFEATGPTEMIGTFAPSGGNEPFPEMCAWFVGMAPLAIHIFGLRVLEVEEVSCRCRGDAECKVRVHWDESEDLALQLQFTRSQLDVARMRLVALQQTVADIVSTDDLESVLQRVVDAVARSTSATGFVLELALPIPGIDRYFSHGIEPAEVAGVVASAVQGEPGYLVVDVGSNVRHYGRLIVLNPTSQLSFELPAIQGYSRLAATALDSAMALGQARRQAAMSKALLELSTALAELMTTGELATKVVQAMPAVIDADCAAVLLISDGVARVAASYGLAPEEVSVLDNYDVEKSRLDRVLIRSRDQAMPQALYVLERTGMVSLAVAPISIDGEIFGLLLAGVRDHPERISEDEHLTERFSGLAGQAAVALRNGRLLDQIRHQSLHDPLTDLPNRALILDRAEQMLSRARRHHRPAAVLFIDLDGFKEINDTLGHGAGDDLLRLVADRLRTAVRTSDTVGRLGGDEFVVLVEDATLGAGIEAVGERLLDVLHEPFHLDGKDRPMTVNASIGIATGDRGGAADLLRDADIALYSAKSAGKGCFRVFAPEMQDEVRARADLAEGLRDALSRNEFFLVYQPIFDLELETATGVEALLRWNHPQRGVVPPDEFIPLLEESGLIVEVGRWVLQEACRQTAEWHAQDHRIDVSVNASIRQLERPGFAGHVSEALASSGLPPTSLIVEITETAIMRDADATVAVLEELKQLGVRVAIDDFGTGYSSLAYLRQFPVDALKIDRSFIAAVAESPAAVELIHTLVRLGKALNLETLAEGIERRDQLERLQDEGCDSGQGYMFARPLPPTDMPGFLLQNRMQPVR